MALTPLEGRLSCVQTPYYLRITFTLGALPTGLVQQFLELPAVGGDQFLFHLAALDFHRYIVVIGTDQAAASLKVGDLHDLRLRQVEQGLDTPGLLVLQVEEDLGFSVVDNALLISDPCVWAGREVF